MSLRDLKIKVLLAKAEACNQTALRLAIESAAQFLKEGRGTLLDQMGVEMSHASVDASAYIQQADELVKKWEADARDERPHTKLKAVGG